MILKRESVFLVFLAWPSFVGSHAVANLSYALNLTALPEDLSRPLARAGKWNTHAEKGLKYCGAWQVKTGPDVEVPKEMIGALSEKFGSAIAKILPNVQEILGTLGKSEDEDDYTAITVRWPKSRGGDEDPLATFDPFDPFDPFDSSPVGDDDGDEDPLAISTPSTPM